MSNQDEFLFGYNPIDPNSFGHRTEYDVDGDGILDDDENADLDPSLPGIQNPFDSSNGDTTGDCGNDFPDGIPDGENDYDCDGMSKCY